jgi:hypothetical protein
MSKIEDEIQSNVNKLQTIAILKRMTIKKIEDFIDTAPDASGLLHFTG